VYFWIRFSYFFGLKFYVILVRENKGFDFYTYFIKTSSARIKRRFFYVSFFDQIFYKKASVLFWWLRYIFFFSINLKKIREIKKKFLN